MAEQTVLGPDGRIWTVGRKWFHRAPRWRRPERESKADGSLVAEFGLEAVSAASEVPAAAIVIAVLVVLALGWAFVFPALIFLADLVFIVLVAAIGVAVRVLFRRPWNVVAETDDAPAARIEIPVAGYRAASARIDDIAYLIQTTGSPVPR